jgi:hypothetical protein
MPACAQFDPGPCSSGEAQSRAAEPAEQLLCAETRVSLQASVLMTA